MASAVVRLFALLALILMPLSMAGTPANAQPAAGAPSGHCDDHQKSEDTPKGQQIHCTGCTAFPVMEPPIPFAELRPQAPIELILVSLPAGIVPETATPPPKRV